MNKGPGWCCYRLAGALMCLLLSFYICLFLVLIIVIVFGYINRRPGPLFIIKPINNDKEA